jgi:uncharacterized repeat protein (TIGR03803 family)/YD repeat-containing protein
MANLPSKNVNRHRKNHYLKLASLSVLLMANPLFAQTVRYAYDKDGRLTQVTRDDGIVDAYQYDVANNLIKNTGVADNTAVPFSLTDYTPKSAIIGAVITITGTAFSNPTVSFNGTPATVTSSTDTSLTVAVPTGATSGPLTVTVGGQTLTAGVFNVLTNPNTFSVADFTPKSAAIGNSFTVTGTGFTNPTITINGTLATVTASTATSITVTVPPGVTSGPVIVTVGGQSQTVGTFTVATPVPSFTVTDFTPKSAPVGSAVTISGTGFTNPTVAFNGIAAPVTITDTSITATVPVGATSGPLTVTVGNQTQEAGIFTVASAVAPVLTAYSLPVAQAGDTITLAGANFDISSPNANLVKVGGIRANVTAVNATQLTFVVPQFPVSNNPPGTPGTAQTVTVQTAAGATTALKPLYLVPRIIFNKPFSPTATAFGDFTAPGDNGLLLAQSGQYNVPVQGVNINGSGRLNLFVFDANNTLIQTIQTPAKPFSSLINGNFQATTGTFTLPSGGPYVIQTVFETDPTLGFQATGTLNFDLSIFSVTGYTPQSGIAGDRVTITGSRFSNPTVEFNGALATVTDKTATSITVTVPSGATTGSLVVTDQGVSQNAGGFTVNLATSSNLHTFTGSDGANPFAGLLQASDGNFYGTNYRGGTTDQGNIFRVAPDGTLTVLHSFNGTDGLKPNELIQAQDGNFYGTTKEGGTYGNGTIFRVTPNGTLTTLYSFNGIDGNGPRAGLTQASDDALYGTTYAGGTYGEGTLFRLELGGTLTTVYAFGNGTDAANPSGHLIQAKDGELYGTTEAGGSEGSGTVYHMTLSGSETILKSFGRGYGSTGSPTPVGGVVQSGDGTFYGTLSSATQGVFFSLNPSGNGFVNYFSGSPAGGLMQARDGNFYGITTLGGSKNLGTVFRVEPKGSFKTLYSFDGQNGSRPFGGIIQGNDGNFYGPTFDGGANNKGTIFKLTPQGFPTITSFTPGSGSVGSSVVIIGTNFTDATDVAFIGVFADFTVDSPTQITATVPPDISVNALLPKIFNTNFTLLHNKNIAANGFFSLGTLNATRGKFISLVGPRPKFSVNPLLAVSGPSVVSATGFITVTTPNGSTTSLKTFTVVP